MVIIVLDTFAHLALAYYLSIHTYIVMNIDLRYLAAFIYHLALSWFIRRVGSCTSKQISYIRGPLLEQHRGTRWVRRLSIVRLIL
jgi:hypothetical protein